MAAAAGLSFDASFIKRLAQAEEKLLSIQKASNTLQNNTIKAFQQMTQQGVVPYVDQLMKQKEAMEAIAKVRLGKNSSGEFRAMKQQAKDAVKEINKVINALTKTQQYQLGASGATAISFANSLTSKNGGDVKSIQNFRNAIAQLEAAMKRQNLRTREGRKNFNDLNKTLLNTKAVLAKLTGESRNLQNSLGPLGSRIAAVFSIQALTRFVNKMVQVRGEFEIMNKAMQVIIGNKEQANRIWDQTVELAVKSPLSVQELVKNTRQLAAYRIETEKLHDTTRRLADVSAGLGVDMQRLILAYGQVRAASFLRGTELRQFTEAGVPMLEELAKHFTELRGKVVSVDQVFEMISKRQVAFKDVEQVFKNMTSEGGVFFGMQEKMANTTKGQISNLKDSLSLMFNEIGQEQQGWINTVLKTLKTLIENWRYVAAAIKTVIITYAAYQVAGLVAAVATGTFVTAVNALVAGENVATLATNRLTLSIARLGARLKATSASGGWIGLVITLITSAIVAIKSLLDAQKDAAAEESRRQEEMEENIDQLRKKNEELINTVVKLKEAFKEAVDSKNIHDQRIQLQKLIDIANEEYRMKIIVDVDGMTPEEIASQMLGIGNKMEQISSMATSISSTIEQSFGEKLVERSEGVSKAIEDLLTLDTNAINELYRNTVDVAIKEGETTEDYINRLLEIRRKDNLRYNHYVELYNQSLDDPQKHIKTLTDAGGKKYRAYDPHSFFAMNAEQQNLIKAFGKMALALDEFKIDIPTLQQEYQEILKSLSVENAQNLNILDESFDLAIRQIAEQKGLSNTFTNMLIEWTNSFYKIDIGGTPKKELNDWQVRFNDYLAEVRKISEKALIDEFGDDSNIWANSNFNAYGALSTLQLFDEENADLTRTKMKEQIKGLMDEQKAIIKGGLSRTEDEKKMAQIEYDQLNAMYEWFGGEDKGAAKTAKQKLEEQIKLLEEMHKKFLELKRSYGDIKAEAEVRTAYEDTFNEVFAGTGVSFDAYKTFGGFVDAASDAGAEAGTALSEGVINKLKELEEAGTYIRNYTSGLLDFTQTWEGFVPYAYYDLDEWVGGKPPKASESTTKKGTLTIGTGITNNSGIGYTFDENTTITEIENQELLAKIYEEKTKNFNEFLDLNKDLILTQEQYNMLLDQYYQGEASTKKAVNLAKGDWEQFEAYLNIIKGYKQLNKKHVIIDTDAIKQEWESLDTLQEKLALTMKWTNIVTSKTKKENGKDVKEYYISSAMQSRSLARSANFSGDLDIAQQLTDALVDMEGLDFMTKEGMVEALQKLKDLAKKAGPEVEKLLSKTISGYEAEIGLKLSQDADRELREDVQDLFDRHSLTVELKKLQVPSTLAKNLFGIDFLDNAGLKSEVIATYTKNLTGETKTAVAKELAKGVKDADWAMVAKELGDEQVDQIKKDIEKVDDMEDKAQMERIKTYLQYTRAAIGERAKIKVEEMNKLLEIEEAFKPKELKQEHDIEKARKDGKTEAEIKALEKENEEIRKGNQEISERNAFLAKQKALAIEGVKNEATQKEYKQDWEDFKSSDTFVNLFNDLDNASSDLINHAIAQIVKFKDEWTDMPVGSAKEMALKLNELQLALMDTDRPLKDNKKLWKELGDEMDKRGIEGRPRSAKAQAKLTEEVTSENKGYEEDVALGVKRIAILETINNLTAENKAKKLEELGVTKDTVTALGLSEDVLTNTVDANNDLIKGERKQIKNTNDKIAANRKVLNTQNKISQNAQELNDGIATAKELSNDLYDAFKDLYKVLGGDSDSPAAVFADMGMSMANTVLDTVMLIVQMNAATIAAQGLGAAMKSASGIIGWIVMAIELVVQALTAIFTYADKKRQEQIDYYLNDAKSLKAAFDDLGDAIDKALSFSQLESGIEQMRELNRQMDEAIKKAINLQMSGKNKNASDDAEIRRLMNDPSLITESLLLDPDFLASYKKEDREAIIESLRMLKENQEDFNNKVDEVLEELGGITAEEQLSIAEDFVDAWLEAFKETGDGLEGLNEDFDEFFENLIKKKAALTIANNQMQGWVEAVNNALSENSEGGYDITDSEREKIRAAEEDAKKRINAALLGIFDGMEFGGEAGGLSSLQKGIQGVTEQTAQVLESLLNSMRLTQAESYQQIREQTGYIKDIRTALRNITKGGMATTLEVRLVD